MKKNYSLILLTFLLTLHGLLTAQNTKGNNELDNKYSPSENSIFNSLHKKRNNSNSVAEAIDLENAVNFTPTMLLRRKIFFNYERKVGDDFVVSLGLGKALGGDFFQEGGDLSVIDEDPDIRNTFVAYQIYSHSTYSGSSPLLFAGVKLYSDDVFDGSYTELTYRRETMFYTINSDIPVLGPNEVKFRMHGFTFGYGYSWLAGTRNKMTNSIFINIGIKLIKYTRFDFIENSPQPGLGSYYEKTNLELSKKIFPSVNIGYSFGIGF